MVRSSRRSAPLPRRWHGFISAWVPALLWAGLIFHVSSLPGDRLPRLWTWEHGDIILHGLEYLILGALLYRAFALSRPALGYALLALVSWGLAAAYALSDEYHQSFVPGREVSLSDILADLLGAVVGVVLLHELYKRYERIRREKKA
jgi:VanZ family protein